MPELTLPEIEQRIQDVHRLLHQVNQKLRTTQDIDHRQELMKAREDLDGLLVKLMGASLKLKFKAKEAEPKPEEPETPPPPKPSAGNDKEGLLKDADAGSTERSERVTSKLLSLQGKNVLVYQSATYQNNWTQIIQLNLRKNMAMYGIKKAIDGPLYVHCDCPAFKWWGYQYICTTRKVVFPGKENTIFPKIRNPHLHGSVCKHLIHVLNQLPQDARNIYKLLNSGQPWVV